MKMIISISVSILIVMLLGCSTSYNAVSSDYDRSVDFTKYKTFAWLPDNADTTNTPYNNDIIRNNIRNYFGQCMSDRSYSVDLENPDLLMLLEITNTKKERVVTIYPPSYYYSPYYYGSSYYSPYPFGYYYQHYPSYGYGRLGYSGYSTTEKQEYINGAITLNVIDRHANKLIWRGTAEGDIYDPSQINHDLHPAVHRILNDFPVQSLSKRNHKIN